MNRKEAFENWMKNIYRKENGEKLLSVERYLVYMTNNLIDLGLTDEKFYEINNKVFIKKLYEELKGRKSFLNRPKTDQDNNPVPLKLYIQFLGEFEKSKA